MDDDGGVSGHSYGVSEGIYGVVVGGGGDGYRLLVRVDMGLWWVVVVMDMGCW